MIELQFRNYLYDISHETLNMDSSSNLSATTNIILHVLTYFDLFTNKVSSEIKFTTVINLRSSFANYLCTATFKVLGQ